MANPRGNYPIAVLADSQSVRIGAKMRTVNLSAATMLKQAGNHPELTAAEYSLIQLVIDRRETILDRERSLIFILDEADDYVTVVKATQTGEGVFLTSFRRLSSDEVKRDTEITRLRQKGEK